MRIVRVLKWIRGATSWSGGYLSEFRGDLLGSRVPQKGTGSFGFWLVSGWFLGLFGWFLLLCAPGDIVADLLEIGRAHV